MAKRLKSDVWHWYLTIVALAPLNRFYNMVPVNGVYVERLPSKGSH